MHRLLRGLVSTKYILLKVILIINTTDILSYILTSMFGMKLQKKVLKTTKLQKVTYMMADINGIHVSFGLQVVESQLISCNMEKHL